MNKPTASETGIYLSKVNPDLLALMKQHGLGDIATQLEEEKKQTPTQKALDAFITCYPKMLALKEHARKLALVDDCVLIFGRTGTGKELIAHILHGDRTGQFIPINCGGLPEPLVESELFGHVKGAFTGADKNRVGLLEQAKDGTIFLDEIGDMPLTVQVKLLRTIQERKIRPVGSSEERPINCRFICATHVDLKRYVHVRLFREDLLYRINTFVLEPEPLSARSQDIPLIVKALDYESKININEFCDRIDPDLLGGNVRTLQQMVRRYYVLGMMP
jgi:two-component system response regulator GlrR